MPTIQPTSTEPLSAAIAALIDIGGHLSQIVTHMNAAPPRRGPSGQAVVPIPDMLGGLLADTLEPVAATSSPETIATVTAFLEQVRKTMADDIFLVPHEHSHPRPNRAARRRRGA